MLKKIIVSVLALSVVGAGGAALVHSAANAEATPAEVQMAEVEAEALNGNQSNGNNQNGSQSRNGNQQGEPQAMAQGQMGEPWYAEGTILSFDLNGMTVTQTDGEQVYVELGPADYWQTQPVVLEVGQHVTIDGTINGDMIHATTVTLDNGQQLILRTETGQPMWSGGVQNGNGNGGNGNQNASGNQDGTRSGEPQAQVDEWVTIEGFVIAHQGGNMTIQTADDEVVSFQSGQPRFFTEQGVTISVGDEISVLGFWNGDQFTAGEITLLATGERIMLRDPNGRPLWAGSGNGNGGGGNGGGNGSNR
jgi:hypothetical protein